MALVDDDVGESAVGIEVGEAGRVAVLALRAERLTGGDVDAGVFGVVGAVGLAEDLGGVRAEGVLEVAQRLRAQLVAVADEKSVGILPAIRDALEQVDGDEGLARAGGEGKKRPAGFAGGRVLCELLHDGADGGVLIIAAGTLAARVGLKQRPCDRRGQRETHAPLIAGAEVFGSGEIGHGARGGCLACEGVVLDELVAVGGEDEFDVLPPAFGIAFALFESVSGRKTFLFCLDQSKRDRLGLGVDLDTQDVVHLAPCTSARLAVDDFNGSGRLFAPNKILGPTLFMEGRIDQFCAGVGFVEIHGGIFKLRSLDVTPRARARRGEKCF